MQSLHNLHVWAVTSGKSTLTVHLVTSPVVNAEVDALPAVRAVLARTSASRTSPCNVSSNRATRRTMRATSRARLRKSREEHDHSEPGHGHVHGAAEARGREGAQPYPAGAGRSTASHVLRLAGALARLRLRVDARRAHESMPVYPGVVPPTPSNTCQHFVSVNEGHGWSLPLVPGRIAVRARGHDVSRAVPTSIAAGDQMLGRAAEARIS